MGLRRDGKGGWTLDLADQLEPGDRASVSAKIVLNMAGIWIDKGNALAAPDPQRRVCGTEGTPIMVRLPPECTGYGLVAINRPNPPFSLLPRPPPPFSPPPHTPHHATP